MGVYANGKILFGFVHDDDTADLFSAIVEKWEEEHEDGYAFEEMYEDLQEKHSISLYSASYANVDILDAYSASASGKSFGCETIKSEDMAKTEEYAANIKNFLEELGIDSSKYQPGWHILGYMD